MERRPTLGDIVACAGVGAMAGAVLLGLGFAIFGAVDTGRIENAGWAIISVPVSILLAIFTAWPIGCIVGVVVMKLFGWGYPQAAVAGMGSGLAVAWLFGFSSFSDGSLAMTTVIISAGALSGLFAWRAVVRTAQFQ